LKPSRWTNPGARIFQACAGDDITDANVCDDTSEQEYEEYEEADEYEGIGEEEHAEEEAEDMPKLVSVVMTWPVDCSLLLRGACYTVGHVGLPNAGDQGSEEYRAFDEWWAAVHSDLDSRVNGTNYKHGRGCNHTNAESDACTARCHPFVFPQLPPPTDFPGVQVPSRATNVYEGER